MGPGLWAGGLVGVRATTDVGLQSEGVRPGSGSVAGGDGDHCTDGK